MDDMKPAADNPKSEKWELIRAGDRGMAIRSLNDLREMATLAANSVMAPKAFRGKPQDCAMAIQLGMELRLPGPMMALMNIHVIEGTPALAARLQGTLIQAHPECQDFTLDTAKDERGEYGICITVRRGQKAKETRFYLDEAEHLLGKDNWKRSRQDMLAARVLTRHARRYWGDATMGLYSPEEFIDGAAAPPPEIDITPKGVHTAEPRNSASPDPMLETLGADPAPPAPATTPPVTPLVQEAESSPPEDGFLETDDYPAENPFGDDGPEPIPVDLVVRALTEADEPPFEWEAIEALSRPQREELLDYAARKALGIDVQAPPFWVSHRDGKTTSSMLDQGDIDAIRIAIQRRAGQMRDPKAYERVQTELLRRLKVDAIAEIPKDDVAGAVTMALSMKFKEVK